MDPTDGGQVPRSGLTRAFQLKVVGEGLAIGCISVRATSITANKMKLESAFMDAWRSWSRRSTFPGIKADYDRNDIMTLLYDSDRRRGSNAAWQQIGATHEPFIRSDHWDVDDVASVLASSTGVQLDEWVELAKVFIDEL